MNKFFYLGLLSLAVVGCDKQDTKNPPQVREDTNASVKTPLDQSESEADRTLTQQIRQRIMADDALSMSAKNIKIITINGVVTLRGPVATAKEKEEIVKQVHEMQGVKKIENHIEISQK